MNSFHLGWRPNKRLHLTPRRGHRGWTIRRSQGLASTITTAFPNQHSFRGAGEPRAVRWPEGGAHSPILPTHKQEQSQGRALADSPLGSPKR